MINPQQRDALIALRIEQAENTHTTACKLIDDGEFATAINRIYYGMFYALLALALKYGYESSKHQQLIGWFNKEFVNTGKVSKELGKMVKKSFDRRINADYEIASLPEAEEMHSLLAEMDNFISHIKQYIQNQ